MKATITKIEPSQIGTRIEFTDGFYTEASVEMNKYISVTLEEKTYWVGNVVEISHFHEKAVYAFE